MIMTAATAVAPLLRPHKLQHSVVSVNALPPEPLWQQVPPPTLKRSSSSSSEQHNKLSSVNTTEDSATATAANEAIAAILASPKKRVQLSARHIRALTEVAPNSEHALKLDAREVQRIANFIAQLGNGEPLTPPRHALDDLVGAIRAVRQTHF